MILTDGNGRPFAPVEAPAPNAPIGEVIAFLRATAARNDSIASCASGAFDRQFQRNVKGAKRRSK